MLKSTGNPDIDKCHEKMIGIIQNIKNKTANNIKEIKEELDNLYQVSKEHFTEEETLMRDINYPFSVAHFAAHDDILKKIETLKNVVEYTKEIYLPLLKVTDSLIEKHVEHFDVALFEYNAQIFLRGQTGDGATSSLPS